MTPPAVIVICSTPYSNRLQEKCFYKINGIFVLRHIAERIKDVELPVILAIPEMAYTNPYYQKYAHVAKEYGWELYCGNKESPLHRCADALKDCFPKDVPKYVIRITHDDILIEPNTLNEMVEYTEEHDGTYCCCPEILNGAGVEIILSSTITEFARLREFPIEHLSYFVKGDKPLIYIPRDEIKRPYRLTLDYKADALVLETILRTLGNNASVKDICEYLDKHPALLKYNKLPDVTIYTCVHNGIKRGRDYITETLMSVSMAIRTSKLDIEYIIVEDGSTDNTLERIIEYCSYDNFNKHLIVNDGNLGLAVSSNKALVAARGEYVMRIDADDILEAWSIDTLYTYAKEKNASIVYPDYLEYINTEPNEQIDVLPQSGVQYVKGNINHHAGGALMHKKTINELKFGESLRHWDSLDLYLRIKNHKNLIIEYFDRPTFKYRVHGHNMSKNDLENRKAIYNKLMGDLHDQSSRN